MTEHTDKVEKRRFELFKERTQGQVMSNVCGSEHDECSDSRPNEIKLFFKDYKEAKTKRENSKKNLP